MSRKPAEVQGMNTCISVISKMNETPSVAVFDVRFKDSLPPIKGEVSYGRKSYGRKHPVRRIDKQA